MIARARDPGSHTEDVVELERRKWIEEEDRYFSSWIDANSGSMYDGDEAAEEEIIELTEDGDMDKFPA